MKIGNKEFKIGERMYIMGILNFILDLFLDGGKFNIVDIVIEYVRKMIEDGVDIIDVGGELIRLGYILISDEEEIGRVVLIIKVIKENFDICVFIDIYKVRVVEKVLELGVDIINDIWGFKKDKDMVKVVVKYNVFCCLMYNRENKEYKDLMEDILDDLRECIKIVKEVGVKDENIILDLGIGFGKIYE